MLYSSLLAHIPYIPHVRACYLGNTQPAITSYLIGHEDFNGKLVPGAHDDASAEGKRRSMQHPCKRLKFENIPTVVPLLFLACT